jgi:chloramphenicol 3-O phosphotransferase
MGRRARRPAEPDGFWYDRSERDEDGPLVRVRYGPVGLRMLLAGHVSAAALTAAGDNLVIDEMLLSSDLLPRWGRALSGLPVLFVGVRCPVDVLRERERVRDGVPGLARGQLPTVHAHGQDYDLEVDTSAAAAVDVARAVLRQAPSARLWSG